MIWLIGRKRSQVLSQYQTTNRYVSIFFKSGSKAPSDERQGNPIAVVTWASLPLDLLLPPPWSLQPWQRPMGPPDCTQVRHTVTPAHPGRARTGQRGPTKWIPLNSDSSPIWGKFGLGL